MVDEPWPHSFFPAHGAPTQLRISKMRRPRLYPFTLNSAFFVARTKSKVLIQRRSSNLVDKTTGVRSDPTIILTAIDSAKCGGPKKAARFRKTESRGRSLLPASCL
jgi:hypothetical protein